MKNVHSAVAAVVLLTAAACSNNGTGPEDGALSGTYRWVSSTGSIAGRTVTPASENYSVTFKFDGSKLQVLRNDSLKGTTTVAVAGDHLTYEPPVSVFVFDPQMEAHTLNVAKGDTIVLSDPCCDRYSHVFVKMR